MSGIPKTIMKDKYKYLILWLVGCCVYVLSVVMLITVNTLLERIGWATIWLICHDLTDKAYMQFKFFNKIKLYKNTKEYKRYNKNKTH